MSSTSEAREVTLVTGQSEDDDELLRGVGWTLKKRRRVASGTNVDRRTLVRLADMLTGSGKGGGIVGGLLPTTEKEKARLERDRALYDLRRVRLRSTGERGKVRDLWMVREFLIVASLLKGSDLNPHWKAKDFLIWVVRGLKDPKSAVYKLAQSRFSILIEKDRTVRWWQDRVTELRKNAALATPESAMDTVHPCSSHGVHGNAEKVQPDTPRTRVVQPSAQRRIRPRRPISSQRT